MSATSPFAASRTFRSFLCTAKGLGKPSLAFFDARSDLQGKKMSKPFIVNRRRYVKNSRYDPVRM
jgi:hypothetical protein